MSEELVVSMEVVPEALPVRRQPQVLTCPRLEVAHGNMVWGSVRGHACTILLASAAHHATASYAFAKRTRLITGLETRHPLLFEAWHGEAVLRVISLPSVTVMLENRVKVRTSLLVLPREVDEAWGRHDVVLDGQVLQWGNMLQTFRGGRSFLYIRDPDNLRRKLRRLSARFSTFKVRRADRRHAEPFKVLLDTSAVNFYLSDFCRQRFFPLRLATQPWRVHIYLVGGCRLKTDPVTFLPSMKYDFVLGKELLFRHSATVDYGRHFICFQVGPNNIKVNLEAE